MCFLSKKRILYGSDDFCFLWVFRHLSHIRHNKPDYDKYDYEYGGAYYPFSVVFIVVCLVVLPRNVSVLMLIPCYVKCSATFGYSSFLG